MSHTTPTVHIHTPHIPHHIYTPHSLYPPYTLIHTHTHNTYIYTIPYTLPTSHSIPLIHHTHTDTHTPHALHTSHTTSITYTHTLHTSHAPHHTHHIHINTPPHPTPHPHITFPIPTIHAHTHIHTHTEPPYPTHIPHHTYHTQTCRHTDIHTHTPHGYLLVLMLEWKPGPCTYEAHVLPLSQGPGFLWVRVWGVEWDVRGECVLNSTILLLQLISGEEMPFVQMSSSPSPGLLSILQVGPKLWPACAVRVFIYRSVDSGPRTLDHVWCCFYYFPLLLHTP